MSAESLLRMLDRTGECWLWTGYVRADGYAVRSVRADGRVGAKYVHRLAYEYFVGPIPEGLTLDHLCRVRHCCNPEHLQPVTSAENTLRGDAATAWNARKTHCKNGHQFDAQNTHYRPTGGRTCRECARAKLARRRAARKGLAA